MIRQRIGQPALVQLHPQETPIDAQDPESAAAFAPAPDSRLKRAYWQLTALALAAHFGGSLSGLGLAIGVTALQTVHFALKRRSALAFVVQVRTAYLALLIAGLLPALAWLHAAQLAGLTALLTYDYCPLARMLALAPWNRKVPLSWPLVRWVILAPPAPGSILDRMPVAASRGTARRGSRR